VWLRSPPSLTSRVRTWAPCMPERFAIRRRHVDGVLELPLACWIHSYDLSMIPLVRLALDISGSAPTFTTKSLPMQLKVWLTASKPWLVVCRVAQLPWALWRVFGRSTAALIACASTMGKIAHPRCCGDGYDPTVLPRIRSRQGTLVRGSAVGLCSSSTVSSTRRTSDSSPFSGRCSCRGRAERCGLYPRDCRLWVCTRP